MKKVVLIHIETKNDKISVVNFIFTDTLSIFYSSKYSRTSNIYYQRLWQGKKLAMGLQHSGKICKF